MNVDIFERAVQDPCSEECDCEDEDPLQEEEQEQEVKRCNCTRQNKPPMIGLQRAITTNSISVTHSRTTPSPTLSRPPRSRASSTSLIRHMSASETANRSRSSCCGIPAHLYGLEKYVSSALDALSAGDYKFHKYDDLFSSSSSSSASPSRGSVPSQELSQSTVSTVPRTQFIKRGRKKSFIEISLSKSFCQ
ncbi:hypothetical protein HG537_0A04160 [Torulaspora globosa]|uniref:Uncharacterized protein n=1 Tax=Torulaspora globosa TaxID=48254 RepID=A0A7H9HLH5_9SACH|nr:hypothetical protein HG537_0A04160 [Torulaspora sp. CBS 2947]